MRVGRPVKTTSQARRGKEREMIGGTCHNDKPGLGK